MIHGSNVGIIYDPPTFDGRLSAIYGYTDSGLLTAHGNAKSFHQGLYPGGLTGF